MINIIYEDNHLLVVEKPVNIPVMEDESKDLDLLTMLKEDIKVRYSKPGEVYLGLVHRLDRPVGGVMVFAKTSKAAARLSKQVQEHSFYKTYRAVVCGYSKPEDTLFDYLVKNRKTNTVTVTNKSNKDAKRAELSYRTLAHFEQLSLVEISLKTGRSHQIRVQFSSRNLPLWGDQRYNKNARVKQQIALWATELSLIHPTTKERMTFHCSVPNTAPWSSFHLKEDK